MSEDTRKLQTFYQEVGLLKAEASNRLGSMYEDLMGGVELKYDGKSFWINGVDVTRLLDIYLEQIQSGRPAEKARRYLYGFGNKLSLILSARSSSRHYNGIYGEAKRLYDRITKTLEYIPADGPLLLGDGGRRG